MGYGTLKACLKDLERVGQLVRIAQEVDPYLEAAVIQRRVFEAGGPAVYFSNIKNTSFPAVCNLFGTIERLRFIFRDKLDEVQELAQARADPAGMLKHPAKLFRLARIGWHLLPKKVAGGPVLENRTTLSQLPQLVAWPKDGGAYITFPQVYTEDPACPGMMRSNLGMYRCQISGGCYALDQEIGLHYQIHRGIGAHHARAIERNEALHVNIFVGGPPAMTLAAAMPLPEGIPELVFAAAIAGCRMPMITQTPLPIHAEADFCITGYIDPNRTLPEGPFGDHLGYYSLAHPFPVMRVDKVYHRAGAIWPFTTVGRPPQEDAVFARFIHEITGPVIPAVIPGVRAVNAVEAAGVHPLLLAVGSERYTPYQERARPQELLTQAHALLGQGQLSLAKYLMIAAVEDAPSLNVHDVGAFLTHVLARVDWRRDLHFQTITTMDTLDYSGHALNQGSKVVIAAVGPAVRKLPEKLPENLTLPAGFYKPLVCLPGVLVVEGPAYQAKEDGDDDAMARFCADFDPGDSMNTFPLVVIVDHSEWTAGSLERFLWVTFTRSDPASDIYGIDSYSTKKHWGCKGALVIDARIKPHHAPVLEEDPKTIQRVEQMAVKGGPLHGII